MYEIGQNVCRSKLHYESRLIQRNFDDNKGDDKKLKYQEQLHDNKDDDLKNQRMSSRIESSTLQGSRGKLNSRIKNQV